MSPIWLIVVLLAILAILLAIATVRSLRNRRILGGTVSLLVALLLGTAAALTGTLAWSFASFEALTREAVAATVRLEPIEGTEARFRAHVRIPGEDERTVELAGDQVFVEARIVKWHPWATAIGLPTAYQLDRIGGRYRSIDDEQTRPRTVVALAPDGPRLASDVFDALADRPWLAPLVDARYGSGTFVAAEAASTIEVRVSASGLLARPLSDSP